MTGQGWTKGLTGSDLVGLVLNAAEEYGVDLESLGEPTCDEIAAKVPMISLAPELAEFVERLSTMLGDVAQLDCPDDCEGKPDAPCAYCLSVNRAAEFEAEATRLLSRLSAKSVRS